MKKLKFLKYNSLNFGKFIFLTLMFTHLIACQQNPEQAQKAQAKLNSDVGIIGGVEWKDNHPGEKYTGIVGIRLDLGESYGHCSGTLIAANKVLTAAHCFYLGGRNRLSTKPLNANETSVIFSQDIRKQSTAYSKNEIYSVSRVAIHPGFSKYEDYRKAEEYDLAIITLSRPVNVNSRVFSITRNDYQMNELDSAYVAGFGLTLLKNKIAINPNTGEPIKDPITGYTQTQSVRSEGFGLLRYTAVNRIAEANDRLLFFDSSGNEGTCTGDSGGPTYTELDTADQQLEIVGVISGVEVTDNINKPCSGKIHVVKVFAHLDWIRKNL